VKTPGDLLALRSDAYEVLDDGQVRLAAARNGVPPNITLSDDYKLVDQLEPLGVPSLIRCGSLNISGPVHLADGVVIEGDVEIHNPAPDGRPSSRASTRIKSSNSDWMSGVSSF
jgi:hypothetical protein